MNKKFQSFVSAMLLVALDMTAWGMMCGVFAWLMVTEESVNVDSGNYFLTGLAAGAATGLSIGLLYQSGVLNKAIYYVIAFMRYLVLAIPPIVLAWATYVFMTDPGYHGFDGLGLGIMLVAFWIMIITELSLFVGALAIAAIAVALLRRYQYRQIVREHI